MFYPFYFIVNILVKTLTGRTITVTVEAGDTVKIVKSKIQDKEGIPLDHQALVFAGRELHNEHTLFEYGIVLKNCTLYLIRKLESDIDIVCYQIFIKTLTGKSFSLEVDDSYTIKMVKDKIQVEEGISTDQQKLIYAGREMDDKLSLFDYSISKASTLHLITKLRSDVRILSNTTFQICIVMTSEKTICIETSPLDTMESNCNGNIFLPLLQTLPHRVNGL